MLSLEHVYVLLYAQRCIYYIWYTFWMNMKPGTEYTVKKYVFVFNHHVNSAIDITCLARLYVCPSAYLLKITILMCKMTWKFSFLIASSRTWKSTKSVQASFTNHLQKLVNYINYKVLLSMPYRSKRQTYDL